jgi:hypothetical protein
MSTRNISWEVKPAGAKAENLPPLCADWDPQFPGTLRACTEIVLLFVLMIFTILFELSSSIWLNVSFGFVITFTSIIKKL